MNANVNHYFQRMNRLWMTIGDLEDEIVRLDQESKDLSRGEAACMEANGKLAEKRIEMDRTRREHGIVAQYVASQLWIGSRMEAA